MDVSSILEGIKFIKAIGSVLVPDKKASCDYLRGNILKIVYNDGEIDRTVLLPYSASKKKWVKVTVTKTTTKPKVIVTQNEPDEPLDQEIVDIMKSLEDDGEKRNIIKEASIDSSSSDIDPSEKDITEKIILLAGPGRDFFNLPITPKMINKKYLQLTFHYNRKLPISFSSKDPITGL